MIFLTSDWHLGHQRICELANRPYNSVDEMNSALIAKHNALVSPNDTVYVLGDVAMGKLESSLPLISAFNGHKHLIAGNHDRCHPSYNHNKSRTESWYSTYLSAGFETIQNTLTIPFAGTYAVLNHFPYGGDSTAEIRFPEWRISVPKDGYLIHGHTHSKEIWNNEYRNQIHIGVDANYFFPINKEDLENDTKERFGS